VSAIDQHCGLYFQSPFWVLCNMSYRQDIHVTDSSWIYFFTSYKTQSLSTKNNAAYTNNGCLARGSRRTSKFTVVKMQQQVHILHAFGRLQV
jgi:hypothetical protein